MADEYVKIKVGALRASILSNAEWSQFVSEELSRYLDGSKVTERQSFINAHTIDGHLSQGDVPPDIDILLGMRGWLGSSKD